MKYISQLIIQVALVLGLGPLFAFVVQQGGFAQFDSSIWQVLGFTLKQAALSTLISIIIGFFVARALARQNLRFNKYLLGVFALPMAMPSIVAVLGVVGLIGNGGLLPGLISPYGLSGILMVHVFFNMPMATRLFYQALQTAPEEGFKLSAQLGLSDFTTFRLVEWPNIKSVLPQISAIIFLLCAASFVVVLTLGGPATTTLEVAIFQSLRMDFDPPRALSLSLLQVALCAVLIGSARAALKHDIGFASLRSTGQRFGATTLTATVFDFCAIAMATIIVLPVIALIIWRGSLALHFSPLSMRALLTSIGIGFGSGMVAMALAWPLAKSKDSWSNLLSLAGLIVPPAVLATGWFLLLRGLADELAITLGFIIALNALIALPYAVAALSAAQKRLQNLAHLQKQLGLTGLSAWRVVEWPLMRVSAMQAFLLATVLSLGDLTAITLLGINGIVTLPTLLRSEMGHYRGADAEGTALLLLILCGALTYAATKIGDNNAHA